MALHLMNALSSLMSVLSGWGGGPLSQDPCGSLESPRWCSRAKSSPGGVASGQTEMDFRALSGL